GGPFWKNKDAGIWSIPKGEFDNEEPLEAAIREFREETGATIQGEFIPLLPVKQKGGKTIFAFAVEGDINAEKIASNKFEIEWPPHSGRKEEFPEMDRAEWFSVVEARKKIIPAQAALIDQLEQSLQ
ncbi:MAG TPA: NUDIX domain-containing protein, partial [Puia sp.]|nr:NUDIX domain-containing protein [Puia sp.]